MTMMFRAKPRYIPQPKPNDCWAVCLQMWQIAEIGYATDLTTIESAPGNLELGGGGISVSAIGSMVQRVLSLSTVQMSYVMLSQGTSIPLVKEMITEVGYVYLGYSRPDGSGHCNIAYGFANDTLFTLDPDPNIQDTSRPLSSYFSAFPSFVGWRSTPAMVGIGYTGRAPWDYANGAYYQCTRNALAQVGEG